MQIADIAYILTPIEFGGAERVSLTFLKNVDRYRFRITVAALVRPWEQDSLLLRHCVAEGYPVTRVPVARRPRAEGGDPLRLLRCFRQIYGFLRDRGFDAVHSHGYFADIMSVPAARLLGIPHLATCHGFISNDSSLRCYNRLDRFLLRFSTRVIAVSAGIRNELIRAGIDEQRISLIRNAVAWNPAPDPDRSRREAGRQAFGFSPRDVVLGYTGRLSPEKGLVHLIDACGLLKRAGVPVRLLLVGEGPQREALQQRAASEGLEQEVVFAGFLPDIERVLRAMDVFVLPSLTEGTPLALLEAMAAGLPSVAAAVGGVPDVIEHGRNGLLVRPGSADEIVHAVTRLLRDRLLLERLSREARETITREYDVTVWTGRVEREYDRLVRRGHRLRQDAGRAS